jgi:hypothetical protein
MINNVNYFVDDPADRDRYRDGVLPDTENPVFGGGGSTGGGGGGLGGGGNDPADPNPTDPEQTLAEVQLSENAPLVIAYGQHVVAGNLVEYDYTAGPPPGVKFIMALGEGPWDSPVEVYYAGEQLTASTSSGTPGYKFHPGTLSTGTGDLIQGTPMYFATSPPYSGTAYIEVRLDETQSAEQRVDKLVGIYKCKKVANYNSSGTVTDSGSYSTNPARVAADVLNRAGKLALIDWPSWVAWRDYCDTVIAYDTSWIKRFECHLTIFDTTNLADVLSRICLVSCTFWQDTGDKIRFLLPIQGPYTPTYTFTVDNCRNVAVIANDRSKLPTGFTATFRDINDQYMTETTVEWVDETLESEVGVNRQELQLPPMHRSQAERVCAFRLNLDGTYTTDVEWVAYGGAGAVLPGDVVKITHPVLPFTEGIEANTCFVFVTNTEDLPEDNGPSMRRIRGRRIAQDGFYDDENYTIPPVNIENPEPAPET